MRELFCCVFGVCLILVFCVNVYITICSICLCLCGYIIKGFPFFLCIGAGLHLKAIKIWVFKFMICIIFLGVGLYLFNCLIFTLCHSFIYTCFFF